MTSPGTSSTRLYLGIRIALTVIYLAAAAAAFAVGRPAGAIGILVWAVISLAILAALWRRRRDANSARSPGKPPLPGDQIDNADD